MIRSTVRWTNLKESYNGNPSHYLSSLDRWNTLCGIDTPLGRRTTHNSRYATCACCRLIERVADNNYTPDIVRQIIQTWRHGSMDPQSAILKIRLATRRETSVLSFERIWQDCIIHVGNYYVDVYGDQISHNDAGIYPSVRGWIERWANERNKVVMQIDTASANHVTVQMGEKT